MWQCIMHFLASYYMYIVFGNNIINIVFFCELGCGIKYVIIIYTNKDDKAYCMPSLIFG